MNRIKRFNDSVALRTTMIFGTMWMCYVFFLYGFGPLFFPKYMNSMMYWSGTVQLWSLPLIMVGQNIMGRDSEARAQQDHETIMAEFELLKQNNEELNEVINDVRKIMQKESID